MYLKEKLFCPNYSHKILPSTCNPQLILAFTKVKDELQGVQKVTVY